MKSAILALYAIGLFFFGIITGCEKASLFVPHNPDNTSPWRLDVGFEEIIKNVEFDVRVTPRSHGYLAEARGRGEIPSGEYAGHRFQIYVEAIYSDIGFETLESGSALVTIRGERFESVMDTTLRSFCCGEGHLDLIDGEYVFTMYGQVLHDGHNHLFAGLASTAGTMNMNIADQTGSIVEPATPPHDPGIGLIEDIAAQYVRVEVH